MVNYRQTVRQYLKGSAKVEEGVVGKVNGVPTPFCSRKCRTKFRKNTRAGEQKVRAPRLRAKIAPEPFMSAEDSNLVSPLIPTEWSALEFARRAEVCALCGKRCKCPPASRRYR